MNSSSKGGHRGGPGNNFPETMGGGGKNRNSWRKGENSGEWGLTWEATFRREITFDGKGGTGAEHRLLDGGRVTFTRSAQEKVKRGGISKLVQPKE